MTRVSVILVRPFFRKNTKHTRAIIRILWGTFAIKNLRKKGRRTFMYIFEVKNLIKTYNLCIN